MLNLVLAFVAGGVAVSIGWQIAGLRRERREFAAEQARTDEWDRVHGVGQAR